MVRRRSRRRSGKKVVKRSRFRLSKKAPHPVPEKQLEQHPPFNKQLQNLQMPQPQPQQQQQQVKDRCRCQDSQGQQCPLQAILGSLFCRRHEQRCQMSPRSLSEPPLNPDRYNKDPVIQDRHNCWDYSMDVIDPAQLTQCDGKGPECEPMFHQPGGTKGLSKELQTAEGRTCAVVSKLMTQDVPDLRRSTFKKKCPIGSSKIALVVHPGEDYHFYRQDPDGFWSHKDGSNPVKRFDAEGKLIWNPQTAARDYRPKGSFLNYKDFCGFWCAPRRKTIRLAR